ncbi:MAG: hypothetical protein CTY38_10175 [Methylotenera sp.]|uniref:PIN domain-containing protein n=1 Tax=Methylotenera sp. TaxID=2051956 RepID=UPI000D3FFE74|nr:PIN domain-containing protein [Methylotenera sp.]PPC80853.1 MAG: hypothetical protein CTY38_10175 [Methylotenera sp.]
MIKNLLLVDHENKHRVDLSALDSSYSAIIFVGHHQPEPKVKKKIEQKNKFVRVDYQKIDGFGKNALDFHIAFTLGRVFETEPDTQCYILSADKGFDPLIKHLGTNNFKCVRIESIENLPIESEEATVTEKQVTEKPKIKYGLNVTNPELTVCERCKKDSTIEHNGGRWCTNCGRFASPPDPEITAKLIQISTRSERESGFSCTNCRQTMGTGDGIYDDGEWTCWGCVGL